MFSALLSKDINHSDLLCGEIKPLDQLCWYDAYELICIGQTPFDSSLCGVRGCRWICMCESNYKWSLSFSVTPLILLGFIQPTMRFDGWLGPLTCWNIQCLNSSCVPDRLMMTWQILSWYLLIIIIVLILFTLPIPLSAVLLQGMKPLITCFIDGILLLVAMAFQDYLWSLC